MFKCTSLSAYGAVLALKSVFSQNVCVSIHRAYISWSPAGPERSVGAPPRRSGVKVYVLTSWCKWVQYPAPRPSPQPLHRPAICAAKSGNSAPRTKHLENQLDLFLHGKLIAKLHRGFSTQCFAAPFNYLFHYFCVVFLLFFLPGNEGRDEHQSSELEEIQSQLL